MANSTVDRKSSYWWKDLGSICEVYSATNCFDRRISWKHGNGDKIRFWEDWWVGEGKLMDKFPILYVISLIEERRLTKWGLGIIMDIQRILCDRYCGEENCLYGRRNWKIS